MHVRVLFFGMLKDIAGMSEDRAEFAPGERLGGVFDHYAKRFPRLAGLGPSIVLARNQEFASADAEIADGDEIALLPPVSGGSDRYSHVIEQDGNFYALTRQPIDSPALAQRVRQASDGAVITFEGVVRNQSGGRATRYLDYECYEAMAIRVLAEIGREIAAAHSVSRVALVHRLGRMEIGEASVAVIVASPHRKPAFDAALEGINTLKKRVPIWKKEYFVDGDVWVEGDWDERAPRAAGR
jgi:molybdopterin synthase catalytic subunit/molybdopterin converting factor small subunit